jgi:hypothetical protein
VGRVARVEPFTALEIDDSMADRQRREAWRRATAVHRARSERAGDGVGAQQLRVLFGAVGEEDHPTGGIRPVERRPEPAPLAADRRDRGRGLRLSFPSGSAATSRRWRRRTHRPGPPHPRTRGRRLQPEARSPRSATTSATAPARRRRFPAATSFPASCCPSCEPKTRAAPPPATSTRAHGRLARAPRRVALLPSSRCSAMSSPRSSDRSGGSRRLPAPSRRRGHPSGASRAPYTQQLVRN